MIERRWWVLWSTGEDEPKPYVRSAEYVDRIGLRLGFTDDATKALRFPTAKSAKRVRRDWTTPGSDEPRLKVIPRREKVMS